MARKVTVEDRVKRIWDDLQAGKRPRPEELVEVRGDVLVLLVCGWVTGARSPKSGDWWQAPVGRMPDRTPKFNEFDDDIPF